MMKSSTLKYLILLSLVLVFLVSRITFLESDLPPYSKSFYGPIDEFYYSFTAFQKVEKYNQALESYKELDPDTFFPFYLTIEYLTACSLKVFGNNYYGLRIPSVFMGLVILMSFFTLLNKRFGLPYAVAGGLLLLCDYNFLLANRVVEPTIHRMAGLFLLMLLFNIAEKRPNISRIHTFLLGIASGAATLIYPTNMFIVPASLFLSGIMGRDHFLKNILIFGSGMIIIFLPTVPAMFDPWFTKIYGQVIGRVPGGTHEPLSIIGAKLRVNILSMGLANFLSYNGYLLYLFIISIVFFMTKKIWNIVDGRNRKMIFSVAFLMIAAFCIEAVPWSNGQEVHISILLCVYVFLSVAYGSCFLLLNFKNITDFERGNRIDATMFTMLGFLFLQTFVMNDFPQKKLIIFLPFFIYFIFWGIYELPWTRISGLIRSDRLRRVLPFAVLLPGLLVSSFLAYQEVYSRPSFERRGAMVRLNDLQNETFIGFWTHAFRLYNSLQPILNYTLQDYTDEKLYRQRMVTLGETFYPGSVTLFYTDKEGSDKLASLGFRLERIILPSRDPHYPDVGLFRYHKREFE